MSILKGKSKIECGIWHTALNFLENDFMLFAGNNSRFETLCLQFEKSEKQSVLTKSLSPHAKYDFDLPFSLGIVGLVSYDDYSPFSGVESQYFEVFESHLVYDNEKSEVFHFLAEGRESKFVKISENEKLYEKFQNAETLVSWNSDRDEKEYLSGVERILSEIKKGRYYQLNYLRYFYTKDQLSDLEWLRKLQKNAGPYGAFIKHKGERLISLLTRKVFQC